MRFRMKRPPYPRRREIIDFLYTKANLDAYELAEMNDDAVRSVYDCALIDDLKAKVAAIQREREGWRFLEQALG